MHGVDFRGQGGTPSRLLESSSELFWATHIGLCESSAGDALNDEVVDGILRAHRQWILHSPNANAPSFKWFVAALQVALPPTLISRCSPDGLLRAVPIGVHFSTDATRAYELAARVSVSIDADGLTGHAVGTVAMLAALLAKGATIHDAMQDAGMFVLAFEEATILSDLLLNRNFSCAHFGRHPALVTLGASLEEIVIELTDDVPKLLDQNVFARLLSAQLRGLMDVSQAL